MAKRLIGVLVALALLAIVVYVSRFWMFDLWPREGLFGIETLRPGGDLWRRWMRDLGLGTYDILLWAVAGFALLSVAQKIWSLLADRR